MAYAALAKLKKNSVSTTLSAGIADSDVTIPVSELSVFYDADSVLITKGIVIGQNDVTETKTEEITITGASGTSGAGNLTGATRGVKADGSIGAAAAWDGGTKIAVVLSTGIYDQMCDNLAAHESGKAPLASPPLTGTPLAPTAAADTDTTQIATTAFVLGQASDDAGHDLGTAAAGTSEKYARHDHVHSANITLIDGGCVHLYSGLGSDHTVSGITKTYTAGENLVFGDICYYKSDGKMWKAKGDAAATMPVLAMAAASISADASGVYLEYGVARDDTWDWTVAAELFADESTAGSITATAPSGSSAVVQIIARALTTDIILFNPGAYIELVA